MLETAVNGLLMAAADSVPGVSGGTIAFILGFYDRFIESVDSLFGRDRETKRRGFTYIMKLGCGWVLGMGICASLLASLFSTHIYFMSSMFIGLTAASFPYIISSERESIRGGMRNIPFAILGAAIVILFSWLRVGFGVSITMDFLHLQAFHFLWIFFSGMAAITAMVLPGISGSTVLLICGVYLPAISAVNNLLHFQTGVIGGLLALATGVIAGAALSIRFIHKALLYHRSEMVWLILGLMAGSFYAIAVGPASTGRPLPPLGPATFSVPGFLTGIAILTSMEKLRALRSKRGKQQPQKQ